MVEVSIKGFTSTEQKVLSLSRAIVWAAKNFNSSLTNCYSNWFYYLTEMIQQLQTVIQKCHKRWMILFYNNSSAYMKASRIIIRIWTIKMHRIKIQYDKNYLPQLMINRGTLNYLDSVQHSHSTLRYWLPIADILE